MTSHELHQTGPPGRTEAPGRGTARAERHGPRVQSVLVATVLGVLALVAGLVLGWPVLVLLSIIFTVVQMVMLAARAAVQRNDAKMSEKLAAKEIRRRSA